MPVFPSVEWFDAVRSTFNGDEAYQRGGGGTCDARVGVKVEDKVFILEFEGKECEKTLAASENDLENVDFYLEMGYTEWEEMLTNIGEHGSADLDHTLNTLDLEREDGLAQSKTGDEYRRDLFFRYNQTFQYFFDASAKVETIFQ